MRKALTETSADNSLQLYYFAYLYAQMAASFVIESERWSLAQELLQPLQILTQAKPPGTASVTPETNLRQHRNSHKNRAFNTSSHKAVI